MVTFYRRTTEGFTTREPPTEDQTRHVALVESFRAKLADTKSRLDIIPAGQLEQACQEFRQLPEVAGEPLPPPATWLDR
jgi:hypothetical protein